MNMHRLARTTPLSRAQLVERVLVHGWFVEEAALALSISVRRAYTWLARFREEGLKGLMDRSSAPKRKPGKTALSVEMIILELRTLRFTAQRIANTLSLPKSTVARVLGRHGKSRLPPLQPPPKIVRYEYKRPGGLIHLDVKKLGRIERVGHRIHGDRTTRVRGAGWEFVHVCIDDFTRLAYVEVLPDEKGLTTVGFLQRATAWFAERGIKVRRVMSDNGSNYVSKVFGQTCKRLGQRHIRTRPYTPRTNGKAERFIQTLLREWAYVRPYSHSRLRTAALRHYLRYYNHHRPHGSLKSLPPISRIGRAA